MIGEMWVGFSPGMRDRRRPWSVLLIVCVKDVVYGIRRKKKKIRQEPADEQKCGVRVECSQWAPQSWGLG